MKNIRNIVASKWNLFLHSILILSLVSTPSSSKKPRKHQPPPLRSFVESLGKDVLSERHLLSFNRIDKKALVFGATASLRASSLYSKQPIHSRKNTTCFLHLRSWIKVDHSFSYWFYRKFFPNLYILASWPAAFACPSARSRVEVVKANPNFIARKLFRNVWTVIFIFRMTDVGTDRQMFALTFFQM